jgi:hypothetical protein
MEEGSKAALVSSATESLSRSTLAAPMIGAYEHRRKWIRG